MYYAGSRKEMATKVNDLIRSEITTEGEK